LKSTGSAVPYFQSKVDFLETLMPLCNTVELLDHKILLERRIQGWREMVEKEKKSEFMDEFE